MLSAHPSSQDRQCTYNITWRRIHETIVAVENKLVLNISVCVCVCAYSLARVLVNACGCGSTVRKCACACLGLLI